MWFSLLLITGDTLFLGGCGRFFEGNATQMYEALIKILSQLPDDTVRKLIDYYLFTMGTKLLFLFLGSILWTWVCHSKFKFWFTCWTIQPKYIVFVKRHWKQTRNKGTKCPIDNRWKKIKMLTRKIFTF